MSRFENVYLKLPIFVQNIICNLEGLRIQYSRFNKNFYRYLEEAEKRSYWTRGQLFEYRDKKLREFVIYAFNNAPYYRKKFIEWGVDPKSIKTLEDLKNIPILTKEEVKKHFTEFISDAIPKSDLVLVHTSGTTGAGFRFYTTKDSIWQQWAIWWRYRRWRNIPFSAWCGYFGGRSVVPVTQNNPLISNPDKDATIFLRKVNSPLTPGSKQYIRFFKHNRLRRRGLPVFTGSFLDKFKYSQFDVRELIIFILNNLLLIINRRKNSGS
jgi:phenylacetate-CoA ligase